jgi:hypothetical protein
MKRCRQICRSVEQRRLIEVAALPMSRGPAASPLHSPERLAKKGSLRAEALFIEETFKLPDSLLTGGFACQIPSEHFLIEAIDN